jgi:hypothetical protein
LIRGIDHSFLIERTAPRTPSRRTVAIVVLKSGPRNNPLGCKVGKPETDVPAGPSRAFATGRVCDKLSRHRSF